MKYTTKHYAKALLSVLSEKSAHERNVILQKFIKIISKHGALKNLGFILQETERQYLKNSETKKILLESVAPAPEELKHEIKTILGRKNLILEKINPGILAGIKIVVNNELLVDASARTQLRKLFASRS